ncbi:hypothetical protein [Paraburkholderia humisilvae]|uniref:Uncharacterized protein n=1 Tax=Paraburkholderia humisilvae TaxID=627669 RepID=A0A6J5DRA0_9BURK|nr:hypothetical protein [Paraburkholderia humisilvae]CAB3755445.1 hypothetical protein LMG29542_02596 [Paraburkholderia humisilvae]
MDVVSCFADWLTWLNVHGSTPDRSNQILQALESSENSFRTWSSKAGHVVTAREEVLLELIEDGPRKLLRVEAAYLLGWAATRSYIQRINESRGFAAPYELVRLIDSFGVGYAGIADALLALSDAEWQPLRQEVEASLSATMPGVLEDIPSPFPPFDHAKQLWDGAIDAEQAINRRILEVPFPTFLPRILADMGRRDVRFLAKTLDSTAGPWVSWPCLAEIQTDGLIELLRHVDDCYQDNGTWTKKWTGRLILNHLELDMRLEWEESDESSSEVDAGARTQAVKDTVTAICRVLEGHDGGQILLTRWAAHLVVEATNAEGAVRRGQRRGNPEQYYYAALNGLIDSVNGQAWATVAAIRRKFPAKDVSLGTGVVNAPVWIDWLGRVDHTVPLACAVAFQLFEGASHVYDPELAQWLAAVMVSLRDEPSVHYLAAENANLLTRLTGWPLFIDPNRREQLQEIWQQLALTRVEARFRRDYNSASATEVCASVANIAVEAMSWGATMLPVESAVDSYAVTVAGVIDELRYFVPSVGRKSWSISTSRLVSVMAATGRLSSQDALQGILSRYVGDIDALALASASAIANGVAPEFVAAAMSFAGVSPQSMTSDYCAWQIRAQHNRNRTRVTEILQDAYDRDE